MPYIYIVFFILTSFYSCTYIEELKKNPDSTLEEIVEEILETAIEMKTGVKTDIDLTPGSPE